MLLLRLPSMRSLQPMTLPHTCICISLLRPHSQVPVSPMMNGRRLLHLTLREDLGLELGLGEVVVPPGKCVRVG